MLQVSAGLAVVLALSSAGDAQPVQDTTATVPFPELSALWVAQRVTGYLAVSPLSIVEDSRCPADVLCVHAGKLVVNVLIERNGRTTMEVLELGGSVRVPGAIVMFTDASERRIPANNGEAEQAYQFRFTFMPDTGA